MSSVTDILTGLINLKRNTSYLFDVAGVSSSLSVNRQPYTTSRLIIEIAGNTVSNGRVTVFTSTGGGVAEYVVQDRVLATKWAIKVSDGVVNIVASASAASSEPIIKDNLLGSSYWRLFINDGVIGIESTVIVQNDNIILNDTVTSTSYQITISDGIIGITTVTSTSEVFEFSSNTEKAGVVNFITIDGITTSGISNGFISIRAVNKMGQPINRLTSVSNNVPARFFRQNGRIKIVKTGDAMDADYMMMAEPDLDIRENDVIYPLSGVDGLTMETVRFVEKIFDFDGITHHTECVLGQQ